MTITYFPLLHATGFVERATQYEPAGHAEQITNSMDILGYWPAGHEISLRVGMSLVVNPRKLRWSSKESMGIILS